MSQTSAGQAGDGFEQLAGSLRALSGWRKAATAIGAGACGALAMAPVYALPLLAVAFSVLILLIDAASASDKPLRRAFWTGWQFGFGYFLVGVYWMAFSFFVQAEEFAWMAPFAVTGMPAFLGLFTGAACLTAAAFWRPGWRRVVLFACVWALFEFTRGHVLTGLPWNLAGQALAGSAIGAQTAAWYGAYGLSLITVLIAAAPAAWAGYALPIKRQLLGPIISIAATAVLFAIGAIRLVAPEPAPSPETFVRIIQPNIPQREKIDPGLWRRNFDRQLALSSEGLPDRGRIFIIWPENGAPLINEAASALADMEAALSPNAVLIAGAVRRAEDETGKMRFYNSIAVTPHTAQGRKVVGFYDKHHLVPFGEYLPLQGLLRAVGLAQLAPYDDGFSAGEGPKVMKAGGPSFAPMICYEAIFPGAIYPRGERPDWLLTVTNDAWFGDTSGPRQHLDQARLRSIESGLPMARSANTGISALIDAKGRIVERVRLYEPGRIDAALPGKLPRTIYDRVGNWFFFALVAVFFALSVYSGGARSRGARS